MLTWCWGRNVFHLIGFILLLRHYQQNKRHHPPTSMCCTGIWKLNDIMDMVNSNRPSSTHSRLCTCHYTVTTRMTSALRWTAMRAILMFHNCFLKKVTRQCPQTVSTEEKGKPKQIRTEVLPLGQNRLQRCTYPFPLLVLDRKLLEDGSQEGPEDLQRGK